MDNKLGSGKNPCYRNLKYCTVLLTKGLNKTMKSVRKAISKPRLEPAAFNMHSNPVITKQDPVTIIVRHVT